MARDVAVDGEYVYVADSEGGLAILRRTTAGGPQDSYAESLSIGFTEDVRLWSGESALRLHNNTTGTDIDLDLVLFDYDAASRSATWDFSGLPGGRLPNGDYTATLSAAAVTDGVGNRLGEDYTFPFSVAMPEQWTGTLDEQWADGANWATGYVPSTTCGAVFDGATVHQPSVSDDRSVLGVDFHTAGWTIGGTGHTLSVGAGGIDSAGDGINTVDSNVAMGTDSTWTVGDKNTLVLNGTLGGGNYTLTKDGPGRLVLAGGQDHASGLAMSVGAGMVQVAPAAGPLVLSSLSVAETGGAPTARLNIGSGALIVDYDDGAASPLEDVKRWIAAGYNGMTWTGSGLTSSAAALAPITHGLGYAQNNMLFAPYNSFAGQPVDSSCVLVKYTYAGDLNLDGRVDDNDVSILGLYYDGGAVNTHCWSQGDLFGYDGRIDDNDVSILGLTYGLGVGNPLGGGATAVTLAAPTEPVAVGVALPVAAPAPPTMLAATQPESLVEEADVLVYGQAASPCQAPLASVSAAGGVDAAPPAHIAAAGAEKGSAFLPSLGTAEADDLPLLLLTATSTPLAWSTAKEVAPIPDAVLSPDGGVENLLLLPAL
jgi:hypothetical protein